MKLLLSLIATFLPGVALAAPVTYTLMAPIGSLPASVTLKQYMNGMFETIIGLAGMLAVIMIVVCAIRLMGTGSVSGKSEAKQCIWNAIFGVLLAIGSWILLNTINPQLLRNDADLTVVAPAPAAAVAPPGTVESAPTGQGCYFQFKDLTTGDTRYAGAGTPEMCEEVRKDYQADKNTEVKTNCACKLPGKPPTASVATTPPPVSAIAGSVTCPQSGFNLCEEKFRQCTNASCAQFVPLIAPVGNASVALIKAIILQETSCIANPANAVGDGGASGGPMHIKPVTANKYLNKCGLTQQVDTAWLANKANWKDAICLSANYLDAISKTSCGTDVRNMAAAYNGGTGVCAASASCGGDTNCAGAAVQKWECLYDDGAHQQCNGGYSSTRNYAVNVLYCTNHPGY